MSARRVFCMVVVAYVVGVVTGIVITLNNVGRGKWHVMAETNTTTEVSYKMGFK